MARFARKYIEPDDQAKAMCRTAFVNAAQRVTNSLDGMDRYTVELYLTEAALELAAGFDAIFDRVRSSDHRASSVQVLRGLPEFVRELVGKLNAEAGITFERPANEAGVLDGGTLVRRGGEASAATSVRGSSQTG